MQMVPHLREMGHRPVSRTSDRPGPIRQRDAVGFMDRPTGHSSGVELTTLSGWTLVAIPSGSGVTVTPNNPVAGIDKVEITVAKGANTELFGRLQAVSAP